MKTQKDNCIKGKNTKFVYLASFLFLESNKGALVVVSYSFSSFMVKDLFHLKKSKEPTKCFQYILSQLSMESNQELLLGL